MENFWHPSLRAKKYQESHNIWRAIWRARVNRYWRFYSVITGDTKLILNIMTHTK